MFYQDDRKKSGVGKRGASSYFGKELQYQSWKEGGVFLKYAYAPFIIIEIGLICAELILLLGGETNMDKAGWISITVALIAVASGVWTQFVQFMKDKQRIESVKQTAGEVKADTSEMKPKINTIEELSKQISDDIVRSILPKMESVGKIGQDVDSLLQGYNLEKEIKSRISPSLNPEYLIGSIQVLYEENAASNTLVRELTEEKYILQNENNKLKQEVIQLKEQNERLKKENSELNQQMDYIIESHARRDRGERTR